LMLWISSSSIREPRSRPRIPDSATAGERAGATQPAASIAKSGGAKCARFAYFSPRDGRHPVAASAGTRMPRQLGPPAVPVVTGGEPSRRQDRVPRLDRAPGNASQVRYGTPWCSSSKGPRRIDRGRAVPPAGSGGGRRRLLDSTAAMVTGPPPASCQILRPANSTPGCQTANGTLQKCSRVSPPRCREKGDGAGQRGPSRPPTARVGGRPERSTIRCRIEIGDGRDVSRTRLAQTGHARSSITVEPDINKQVSWRNRPPAISLCSSCGGSRHKINGNIHRILDRGADLAQPAPLLDSRANSFTCIAERQPPRFFVQGTALPPPAAWKESVPGRVRPRWKAPRRYPKNSAFHQVFGDGRRS